MLNEIINRLRYIDILIRENKTGNAEDLAVIVGVSVRTVYKYLDLMKRLGAPIAFNALSKTYYYETEGSFICAFTMPGVDSKDKIEKARAMKLSMISINDLIQQMNKTIAPHNN